MQSPIIDLIYRAHRKLTILESRPHDYGVGGPLYPSEVHTLVEIDRQPGINLTKLADALKVTKPAVSKFVRKLAPKGLLRKERRDNNRKEVVFFLTAEGSKAVQGHERHRNQIFSPLFELEAGLSEAERSCLLRVLGELHEKLEASIR